jgi:long-chain fatty acid transport protein
MKLAWVRSALALTLVCGAEAAVADNSNFKPYALGGRAAGMGGAFTAISDDGSGGYYNPGGLAFASRSSLSLSASVYGFITGSYHDALLPGQDYSYGDLQVFPVSTSVVRKFGAPDPETGVGNNTLVFSIFVPDAVHNDDRALLGQSSNSAFFLTQDNQTLWVGGGYAHRFGRLGVGAMAYVLVGSSIQSLSISAVDPANSASFGELTFRFDESSVGVLGSLGFRLDATDHLSFGLSVYSPPVGTGSRRVFGRITSSGDAVTPPQMVLIHADDLSGSPTQPLRLQGGAAYHQGPLTLAADLVFLAPRTVIDDADRAAQGFENTIIRQAVVDVAVGGEYVLNQKIPLRAGLYTDFSQALSRQEQATRNPNNTEHLNRYGLTLSAGYLSEHVRTDVGLNLVYGAGEDLVPIDLDITRLRFTDVRELNAYLFLATSYEF